MLTTGHSHTLQEIKQIIVTYFSRTGNFCIFLLLFLLRVKPAILVPYFVLHRPGLELLSWNRDPTV